MHRHKISVCMATYNGAEYVAEQIHSILVQLAHDDELLIVDDRSSDATLSVVRRIASHDGRVNVIAHAHNAGVTRAFEFAIASSKHDLIVLSDQDDVWLPGKVESLRGAFSEPEVSAVLSNAMIFSTSQKSDTLFFPSDYTPRLSVPRQFIRNDVIGCCFAFRRTVLHYALPVPSFASMHDWWLGVVAISVGKVVYDPVPRIRYRRHDRNVSPSVRRSLSKIFISRLGNLCALIILITRLYGGRKVALHQSDGA